MKGLCGAVAGGIVIVCVPSDVTGQGLINFANTSGTLVRTNAAGDGGGVGNTSPIANGFAYGLFIAPPSATNISPLDLLTPTWTFTGLYASNTAFVGKLIGGFNIPVPGWDDVTNSFVVAGWSANIAGTDWAGVAAQLNGASLNNGVWSGQNWQASSAGGFFGVSSVGFGVAPDPSRGVAAFSLFGFPNAQGTPISTGWDLFVVNTPEPSLLALTLIGVAAVFGFRRRNLFRRR